MADTNMDGLYVLVVVGGSWLVDRADRASALTLNQGTIYRALLRLEQQGWISASRGQEKQLALEEKNWARTVSMVNRLLEEDV
jgi:DNA-binding PadR family transcriptional regulator